MKTDIIVLGVLFFVMIASGILNFASAEDTDSYKILVDGMTNPVSNSYFAETGWREVQDWEIESCAKKLSSELQGEVDNGHSFNDQNFAYGTSITMQASYTNNYGDYYHELAWYIQPTLEDITFSLKIYTASGEEKVIVDKTKITQYEGKGFYHAFLADEPYYEAKIFFDEGVFSVKFVENK